MSVFKDFPGLENLEKLFQEFQGPATALLETVSEQRCQCVHPLQRVSPVPERLENKAEMVLVVEMTEQSQAVELVLVVGIVQTLQKLQLLQTSLVPGTHINTSTAALNQTPPHTEHQLVGRRA